MKKQIIIRKRVLSIALAIMMVLSLLAPSGLSASFSARAQYSNTKDLPIAEEVSNDSYSYGNDQPEQGNQSFKPEPEAAPKLGLKLQPGTRMALAGVDSWQALADAIAEAPDNDEHVIEITGDIDYPNSQGSINIPSGKNIRLVSNGDWTLTTRGNYRHFIVGGVFTLTDGATLTNYDPNEFGGGVEVSQAGTLNMTGGTIKGNKAEEGGGVIVRDSGVLNMSGGTISNNQSTRDGAGVSMGSDTRLTVNEGSKINHNVSERQGGGVRIGSATVLTINGGEINHNRATHGAGVYGGITGKMIMNGGEVCFNEVSNASAGVYVQAFEIHGGRVDDNFARNTNGGVFAHSVLMTGGSISNNRTEGVGGGANIQGGVGVSCVDFKMHGGEIKNNKAYSLSGIASRLTFGGGVGIVIGTRYPNTGVEMTGGVISGNEADMGGGIGYWFASGATPVNNHIRITGGEISGNIASRRAGSQGGAGGGIAAADMVVEVGGDAVIDNNTSFYGGGILVQNGFADIKGNARITNNNAPTSWGGGIYALGSGNLAIGVTVSENAVISGNNATAGGGIGLSGPGPDSFVNVSGGTISDNQASNGGGIRALAPLNVEGNAVISGNRANAGGGVNVFGVVFTMNGGSISGNIANGGGAVWTNNDFIFGGGEISGNTANITGGGIFATNHSRLNISDEAVFFGNFAGTAEAPRAFWLEAYDDDDMYNPGTAISVSDLKALHGESINWYSLSDSPNGNAIPFNYLANNFDLNFVGRTYTVTFEPGEHGAFDAVVHNDVPPGSATPKPPATPGAPGWIFAGWSPDLSGTVTGEATYVAQWAISDNGGGGDNGGGNGGGGNGNGSGGGTVIDNPDVEVPLDELPFINDHLAYIVGYPDGGVRPGRSITRAEVATVFFRLLTDNVRTAHWTRSNTYTDVHSANWHNNAVSVMSNMGIVKGYADGTFRPNAAITRGELATISARFARAAGMPSANVTGFSDVAGHWAESDILYAASIGWVRGYSDGTFRPNQSITRAEFITLVNRMLGRVPEQPDDLLGHMKVWRDNADVAAWYYLAVQEATNSHIHEYKDGKSVPGLAFEYEYWVSILENPNWQQFEKEWAE